MKHNAVKVGLPLWKILNIVLICGAFLISWIKCYSTVVIQTFPEKSNLVIALVYTALYILFTNIYEAFAVELQRKMELAFSQMLSALFADGVSYILFCILAERLVAVLPLLIVTAVQTAIILLWVVTAKNWYKNRVPLKNVVVVYDGKSEVQRVYKELLHSSIFNILDIIKLESLRKYETDILSGADTIFICCERSSDRDELVGYCIRNNVGILFIPTVDDMLMNSAEHVHIFHMPVMNIHLGQDSFLYQFVKRTADIIVSALALIILSPLMLLTALIIKLSDGGPCIYKQRRLTIDGKEFNLLKFRSMRVDAEADGIARLSTGDSDERVTPFGRFLRRYRLDELPQLINILAGSMSIVGPRPERPEIAAEYEKAFPEFRLRTMVKAGITGYAQIYGSYSTPPKDKLQLDLMYISRQGIIEDLRIMFATIKVLFIKESTVGVSEGQVTAMTIGESEEFAGFFTDGNLTVKSEEKDKELITSK